MTDLLDVASQLAPSKIEQTIGQKGEGKDLKTSASQFESYLTGYMFESMYKTIPKNGFLGGGPGGEMFQTMLFQQFAAEAAQSGQGLGIAEQLTARSSAYNLELPNFKLNVPDLESISSGYGERTDPILGVKRFHHGIDFALSEGTPIKAAGPGVVTFSGPKGNYGKTIVVDHGHELRTLYGHTSETAVRVGQKVKQGDVIGYAGHTGRATGSHLHFEVQRSGIAVNPGKYIAFSESL